MQLASLRRLAISLALQLACGFALSSPSLRADDSWPQFRGPTGQGIAVAANLPLTWSETENVRWKTVIPAIQKHFETFGAKLPAALKKQLKDLAARLG